MLILVWLGHSHAQWWVNHQNLTADKQPACFLRQLLIKCAHFCREYSVTVEPLLGGISIIRLLPITDSLLGPEETKIQINSSSVISSLPLWCPYFKKSFHYTCKTLASQVMPYFCRWYIFVSWDFEACSYLQEASLHNVPWLQSTNFHFVPESVKCGKVHPVYSKTSSLSMSGKSQTIGEFVVCWLSQVMFIPFNAFIWVYKFIIILLLLNCCHCSGPSQSPDDSSPAYPNNTGEDVTDSGMLCCRPGPSSVFWTC